MMFLAIYSDVFSDTDPVKQDKNIFDVPSKVFSNEFIDYDCLGSYSFGISIKHGINTLFFAMALIKLSSPVNS